MKFITEIENDSLDFFGQLKFPVFLFLGYPYDLCVVLFISALVQVTAIDSYFRTYGKSWLSNFPRQSGTTLDSSLGRALGIRLMD